MDSYAVAGQYQQRPVSRRGGLFDGAAWQVVDRAPAQAQKVRAWDFAHTSGGGDWSVGVLLSEWGPEDERKVYVEDVVRGQWDSFELERMLKSTAQRDGAGIPICIPEDPSAGKSLANNIKVRLLRGYEVYARAPRADKETRATPIATQAKAGNVYLVRAEWNQAFLTEARMFPRGKTKDQIDALSDAFAHLVTYGGGGQGSELSQNDLRLAGIVEQEQQEDDDYGKRQSTKRGSDFGGGYRW